MITPLPVSTLKWHHTPAPGISLINYGEIYPNIVLLLKLNNFSYATETIKYEVKLI